MWTATVASGWVVIRLLHREPVDWAGALCAGLAAGILNVLWNLFAEKIRGAKGGGKK